jgi:hypothetical protein
MTYKDYILHQLREMKRELLTATEDVPEEDLTSFEPVGHWPIAWITEHCTEIADKLLIASRTGSPLLSYEDQVENWTSREPQPGDPYPPLSEMQERWAQVCDEAVSYVESVEEERLQETAGSKPFIDNILLAVNHTNSHLRSLWCILGERRVDHKWAQQQNYLA